MGVVSLGLILLAPVILDNVVTVEDYSTNGRVHGCDRGMKRGVDERQ